MRPRRRFPQNHNGAQGTVGEQRRRFIQNRNNHAFKFWKDVRIQSGRCSAVTAEYGRIKARVCAGAGRAIKDRKRRRTIAVTAPPHRALGTSLDPDLDHVTAGTWPVSACTQSYKMRLPCAVEDCRTGTAPVRRNLLPGLDARRNSRRSVIRNARCKNQNVPQDDLAHPFFAARRAL